jgi:murein DD-endopeptidase MepM/ murein hydrolase activator NlpD
MTSIKHPLKKWLITQTFDEHIRYAKDHPTISYNGGIDYYSDDRNIYACDDGLVQFIGFQKNGYGNYIILKHSWGFSLYAHLLEKPNMLNLNEIKQGDVIGQMGTTGNSTGVHLHFECRDLNNKVIDPNDLFEESDLIAVNTTVNGNQIPRETTEGPAKTFKVVSDIGVNFREGPVNGDVIVMLPPGAKGVVTSETPIEKAGLRWWPVKVTIEGFIAESDAFGNKLIDINR